jgi:endonuclease YncB( thermonuclease family)
MRAGLDAIFDKMSSWTRVPAYSLKFFYLLFAVVLTLLIAEPSKASDRDGAARVDYVVDGDTVRLKNGVYVRLIGEDTPEVGQCGYGRAKRRLDRMVDGRVWLADPRSVEGKDHYGRLLRYVRDGGRDTGLALIRRGLAKARYDSTDGYERHPRQRRYHRADRRSEDAC